VATSELGMSGKVYGVADEVLELHAPVPTAFVAATRNTYAVPGVRPVTAYDVFVLPVTISLDHVVPLSLEYSNV
jgi:hypothetical protein